MSDIPIDQTPDPTTIAAENEELHQKLERYEGEKHVKRLNQRKILVGVMVVLTILSITVTTVDTWAHRTLLNTNAWVETVAPLGTDPQVTAALANYVTDQIVTTLDLQARAQSGARAGGAAGGLPRGTHHERDPGLRPRQVARLLQLARVGELLDRGEPLRTRDDA